MNVTVIVVPFEAPGLDFKKKNDVRTAVNYFQGMNQRFSVDNTITLGSADLYTKAIASAPDTVKATLLFLRMKSNGKVLDLTKTFTEQKILDNAFINIEVLVN